MHYLAFTTTKGRTVKVGAAKPNTPIKTLKPACKGGYLYALAGMEIPMAAKASPAAAKHTPGTAKPAAACTPLQQLQFVWGRVSDHFYRPHARVVGGAAGDTSLD